MTLQSGVVKYTLWAYQKEVVFFSLLEEESTYLLTMSIVLNEDIKGPGGPGSSIHVNTGAKHRWTRVRN